MVDRKGLWVKFRCYESDSSDEDYGYILRRNDVRVEILGEKRNMLSYERDSIDDVVLCVSRRICDESDEDM